MQVAPTRVEIEDGIASELSRPVVGRLPAAIGLEDGMREGFAQTRAVACAADGVNRVVLEENEGFVALTALHLPDEILLEGKSSFKRESTRDEDFHRRRSAAGAGNFVV